VTLRLKQIKTYPITIPESNRVQSANEAEFEPSKPPVAAASAAGGAQKAGPAGGSGKRAEATPPPSGEESFFDDRERFSKMESRVALTAFAFIVFVLTAAWFSWDEQYSIVGDADAAYNYGLVGGLMMLVILIYAARKRLRAMRKAGDIRYWYYFHFILGVVGPVLIILHTSFDIRSINGGVALFAMLFVVFSGFIGRYIYTRASYGLRTHEEDLKEVQGHISHGVLHTKLEAFKQVETEIKRFTDHALAAPVGVDGIIRNISTMRIQAMLKMREIDQHMTRIMSNLARNERWTKDNLKARLAEERRLIRAHLNAAANIGRFQAFEKLAGRWRILHVPLLYLLVLSGLAHVLAVHMY
jgi:hypothetical protein